jgi:hypothetical protein
MPRGPKGESRPADTHAAAIKVARIAVGEDEGDIASPESEGKNPAAVELGRMGGRARAQSMSSKRRSEIARKAARQRWKD